MSNVNDIFYDLFGGMLPAPSARAQSLGSIFGYDHKPRAKPEPPRPSVDLVHICCERAARRFGGDDGTFNGAGLGLELMAAAGLCGVVDGRLVAVILARRNDVSAVGGGHYRIVRAKE